MAITAERLRELLHYNPDTGVFTWRAAIGKIVAGDVAGSPSCRGYRQVTVDYRNYKAHRLAWLYMTGAWPKDQIDHINLNKDDNRWRNLRVVDGSKNQANKRAHADNKSGFKGVNWHSFARKWRAAIGVKGKHIHLGFFDTPHQAYAKYCLAARKYHGEFARV